MATVLYYILTFGTPPSSSSLSAFFPLLFLADGFASSSSDSVSALRAAFFPLACLEDFFAGASSSLVASSSDSLSTLRF